MTSDRIGFIMHVIFGLLVVVLVTMDMLAAEALLTSSESSTIPTAESLQDNY